MGLYHTFFVAQDADLDRLFPGWKPAKPKQATTTRINGFTKKAQKVKTWVPVAEPTPLGTPSFNDDAWGRAVRPVLKAANDYMKMIEKAGAPGLRALPHFRGKNLDVFVDFDPLVKALLGERTPPTPPARMGCDEDDDLPTVWALPDAATKKLAALEDAKLPAIMKKVLAHENSKPDKDTVASFVEYALGPLRALAVEAVRRDARVCHYFALHH